MGKDKKIVFGGGRRQGKTERLREETKAAIDRGTDIYLTEAPSISDDAPRSESAMNKFEYRKQFEGEFPPLIDDVYRAHNILAEKFHTYPVRPLTGCTSYIQRKMQCGYSHAAAILELMEEIGGITSPDSKGGRQLMPLPPRSP